MAPSRWFIGLTVLVSLLVGPRPVTAQPDIKPTFKSGVDMVTISAVVRDSRGRLVPNLNLSDFELLDRGQLRRITQFRREESPISLALLLDVSGSMDVAENIAAARSAAHHIVSWLRPGKDEAAVFAFDTRLLELRSFTKNVSEVTTAFDEVKPFGATSLRDAIAATAERVVERGTLRRAVVVLTDGVDTASRLSTGQVAAVASRVDVPVYIVAVVSPLDHPGEDTSVPSSNTREQLSGPLTQLAEATGGMLRIVSVPAHATAMAQQIVTELRQQYLMAFEPSSSPGWHPLVLRTRHKNLVVRARSGYMASGNPTGQFEEELICVRSCSR